MAAITPPLTNSSRLRTRKLLGPNLIWPISCRNRMSPPEPGNRTTSACGFCGTPAIKYDWVTPGRVGSVTISCAEAPATETNNHTHASRFFDFDITRPTQDGFWPHSLLGRLASSPTFPAPCSLPLLPAPCCESRDVISSPTCRPRRCSLADDPGPPSRRT